MTHPTKEYQLTFSHHPGYLRADLTGETVSPEIIRGYIAEVVAESNETGIDRILLYRDIPAVLSAGEVFHTVSESLDALRGKKVALVNPHTAIQENIDFGVTVGKNRGGNYKTFPDAAAAEAWLGANDDE